MDSWEKIRQALFSLYQPPPSDDFVKQVMAKVEILSPVRDAVEPRWFNRLILRIPEWLYPELGIAAAALILTAIGFFQQTQPPISSDALLLSRTTPEIQWVGQSRGSRGTGLDFLWEEV